MSLLPALVATFPLQMALTISVGALCGVVALLLPFPKLALTEAHALVAHATLCTSSAFSILLESYSAQTDERASYLTVQVRSKYCPSTAQALPRYAAAAAESPLSGGRRQRW